MTDYNGPERREGMGEMTQALNVLRTELSELRAGQTELCKKMQNIERSVDMVAGAWLVVKYLVAIPVVAWHVFQWARDHLH